jgi:hypothetical protein
MRNRRSSPANLYRRLETLERSLAVTDKAREGMILNALHHISQEDLEFLIDASLAPRQGRALTEREAMAQQAYTAALEAECRCCRLTVTRIPEAPQLIFWAAMRRISEKELGLVASGVNTSIRGFEPSAEEVAARQLYDSTLQAQYQRAGFGSRAEFENWYTPKPPAPAEGVGARIRR